MKFEHPVVLDLEKSILYRPPSLQIVTGPRQVGKTTAALHLEKRLGWSSVVASGDAFPPLGAEWIETQWAWARAKEGSRVLLVLDEIQKVKGWSQTVKKLWDEEVRMGGKVQPLLLGSSALTLQEGMAESLAGRFVLHRCMHWGYKECQMAFGWNLDQWLFFGGYPGAGQRAGDEKEWANYVADSLVETAIARDVLQLQKVTKPALLRHLFGLCTAFPSQILSYNKMLGQLTDCGNTTTLAGYLHLLGTAFLASGLELYSAGQQRKRGSSPKLIVWNNALINALSGYSLSETRRDGVRWGRLVENAVGASFLNGLPATTYQVCYWRDGMNEVDFVISRGGDLWGIEVKSGRPDRNQGMEFFRKKYPRSRALLVGTNGIPLEDFFKTPVENWFQH